MDRFHPWRGPEEIPDLAPLGRLDGVVHLAGETVAGRWSADRRETIRRSRVLGTAALVGALSVLPEPPRVLVSASAVGFYGDRGEEDLTEAAPPGAGFLAEVCREWEAAARRAEDLGVTVVRVRLGLVLGPGGGALPALLPLFRAGLGGPLGSGRQWWPWVHLDDAVGALRTALGAEASAAVNAVAPAPIRQRDFARTLGRILHRPAWLPAPRAALDLALGGFARELLDSRRVLPRWLGEAGYQWRRPDLEAALARSLEPT